MGDKAGGKYTGNHTTVTDYAKEILVCIEKIDEVSKISPGYITYIGNIGRTRRNVKFFDTRGGIKLVIIGNTSKQEIYIYCKEKEVVQHKIEAYLDTNKCN